MGDHSAAMTAAAMVSAALVARPDGAGPGGVDLVAAPGAYTIGFDVNIALMWGAPGDRCAGDDGQPDGQQLRGRGRPILLDRRSRGRPPLARAGRAVGRDEWLTDERFADRAGRARNAAVLIEELDAIFATRPLSEWADAFEAEPDLFWSPVNTIDDLLADEQFRAAGSVVEVPDELGARAMLATPADFGGRPPAPRWRAPELGEHTREVLAEIDLDPAITAALLADGVAVAPDA